MAFSTSGTPFVSGAGLQITESPLSFFSTTTSNTAQFLILSPGTVRFGYYLDGKVHSLLVASEAGVGVSLGFADEFSKNEGRSEESFVPDLGLPRTITDSGEELSRRTLRLGLGWQGRSGSDRLYEIGVGVSYIDLDVSASALRLTETDTTFVGWEVNSSPGYGIDATFRTLAGSGLLIGLHFAYEDVNPDLIVSVPDPRRRAASVQLGWRVRHAYLDDLVVGLVSRWSMNSEIALNAYSSSIELEGDRETDLAGGFFASGEKTVWNQLVLRAGIHGLGAYNERQLTRVRLRETEPDNYSFNELANASLNNPVVFLGASWTWNSLTFDGRIRDSISLTSPVSRWSVTAAF